METGEDLFKGDSERNGVGSREGKMEECALEFWPFGNIEKRERGMHTCVTVLFFFSFLFGLSSLYFTIFVFSV